MSLGLQGGSHLSHGHVLVFPYELRVRLTTTLYNMRVVCDGWRSLPRVRSHRASKPQGSSERVLPWQITMDQFIIASLSHTHYWYEVGMLKVPAVPVSYVCPCIICMLYVMCMSLYHIYVPVSYVYPCIICMSLYNTAGTFNMPTSYQ